MGREAHLHRDAFGRSAYGEPLHDEDGRVMLGGRAHKLDAEHYEQQFDDRGHPINPISEAATARFYRAQNEVLHACGVVVRKNDLEKAKRGEDLSVEEKIKIVDRESTAGIGFLMLHEIFDTAQAWWFSSPRARLLTFDRSALAFVSSPTALLGQLVRPLPFHLLSCMFRWIRLMDDTDHLKLLYEYLGMKSSQPVFESVAVTLSNFLYNSLCFAIEIPLQFTAILESLGFAILPTAYTLLTTQSNNRSVLAATIRTIVANPPWLSIAHFLWRDYVYSEVWGRIYYFFLQVLPKPDRPSDASVRAAPMYEDDEDYLHIGIGRKISKSISARYRGPTSFWPAFKIAFPALMFWWTPKLDISRIKEEICKDDDAMNRILGSEIPLAERLELRVANIYTHLLRLNIDPEVDAFLDIDAWALEMDIRATERETRSRPTRAQPEAGTTQTMTVIVPMEPLEDVVQQAMAVNQRVHTNVEAARESFSHAEFEARMRAMAEGSGNAASVVTIQAGQLAQMIENLPAGATITFSSEDTLNVEELSGGQIQSAPTQQTVTSENDMDAMPDLESPLASPIEARPSTPEPGIQRAMSLSEVTPRPVRRPTETSGPMSSSSSEQIHVKHTDHSLVKQDKRLYRVSRLSTFAVNCLAWHASSLITNVILLPVDAILSRGLASWATTVFPSIAPAIAPTDVSTTTLGLLGGWTSHGTYYKFLAISFGLEFVVRLVSWRAWTGMALAVVPRIQWGKF